MGGIRVRARVIVRRLAKLSLGGSTLAASWSMLKTENSQYLSPSGEHQISRPQAKEHYSRGAASSRHGRKGALEGRLAATATAHV